MTDRAISSVLDVTVCLLLVSASVLALTHAPTKSDREEQDRADITLEVLTTSTTWVEYESTSASGSNRTAHGTLASLLAAGAVVNATSYDESVGPPPDKFRRAVARAVRQTTIRLDTRAQVIAHWQLTPGVHVQGRFAVGPSPPPSTEVHAASTTVPWDSAETTHTDSNGTVRLLVRTWSS